MKGESVPILVASISAATALVVLAINTGFSQWTERRRRRAELFAKAYAACVSYAEYPYVVRRRRHDEPAVERVRISSELKKVQEEIAFYVAWISTESAEVARTYADLVKETRRIAGGQIREAWNLPAIEGDSDMNMPDLGLGELQAARTAYLAAVRKSLRYTGAVLEGAP